MQSNSIESLTGWNDHVAQHGQPHLDQGLALGRITEEHRGRYQLIHPGGEISATVSGKFTHNVSGREDFPAVGDWVAYQPLDNHQQGRIHAVLPRRTHLARTAPGSGQSEDLQIIAANLDLALIVQSVDRDFNLRRLERYLAITRHGGAQPVVILSKTDLLDEEKIDQLDRDIARIDPWLEVIPTSALQDRGVERVSRLIDGPITACVLGSSGVGKSTLINALAGEEVMATQEIRESDQKGRHTTTHRQMIPLPSGAWIIDTPGMRELAVGDAASGMDQVFSDITALAEECKFRRCSHLHEPECAVQEAIEAGEIEPGRLDSYRKLLRETRYYEKKDDKEFQAKLKEKRKKFAKMIRKRPEKRNYLNGE